MKSYLLKGIMQIFAVVCILFIYTSTVLGQNVLPQKTNENQGKRFRVRVNKGKKFTNKRNILVEIAMESKLKAVISHIAINFNSDDMSQVEWEPLTKSQVTKFYDGQEGEAYVSVQLKDKAENKSKVNKASFVLDETPPEPVKLIINKGAQYSNNATMRVKLTLNHKDAYRMQISNNKEFDKAVWESFVPNKIWVMGEKTEGKRTVYVRLTDQAGNVSATSNTSITFDHTKPTGELKINKGQKFTNSRLINIALKASEDTTIARIISSSAVKNIPYISDPTTKIMIKEWYLDSVQGEKVVKVLFRDRAGNISQQVAQDKIFLDTKPPTISYFKINRGRKFFNDKDGKVTLYIGTRTIDIDFIMLISQDSTFKSATPIEFSGIIKEYKLDSEKDGLKDLYLKFVDKAGNESKIAHAAIRLDRIQPKVNSFVINKDEKFTNKQKISLHSDVKDVLAVQFSNNPSFKGSHWEKYKPLRTNWLLQSKEGETKVYARFRDKAGNITSTYSDTIIKDTVRPKGRMSINNGKPYTNDKDKKVILKFLYDNEVAYMRLATNPMFTNAEWKPVAKIIDNYILDGEDGIKRCYVQYKDSANNLSSITEAKILLDRQPPTNVSILINDDSLLTTRMDRIVKLNLYAEGADKVILSESDKFEKPITKKYMPLSAITLSDRDGKHTIYAKYIDRVGNLSEIASDDIILDRYPPKIEKFLIDDGAEWSNSKTKEVTLTIEASGNPTMMAITSQDEITKKPVWQPFKETLEYTLSGEDGYKVLYLFLKDEYGNRTSPRKASIKLKRAF